MSVGTWILFGVGFAALSFMNWTLYSPIPEPTLNGVDSEMNGLSKSKKIKIIVGKYWTNYPYSSGALIWISYMMLKYNKLIA